MEASLRKPTMFRLKAELVDRLKIAAKRENRSLNNYVESIMNRMLKPAQQLRKHDAEYMPGQLTIHLLMQ